MRYWNFLLVIFCFSITIEVSAQDVFTVNGVISRRLSTERIAQVLVKNLRTNDLMMSDEIGWFNIKAKIGDTLLFSKKGFTDQKIAIAGKGDIPVYMEPVIDLATVTIQGETKKQELNDVMADYRKQGTFYNGKPPALSFLTSPITGLYELFGKTPGEAKRFKAFSKNEIEYAEIRRRYNLKLVKQVTNAPDSIAKKFMEYYTPSYEDIKQWSDYDLIKEVKKSYKYYVENKDHLDLDDLNTPPLKTEEKQKP